jgi:hypothetical protein
MPSRCDWKAGVVLLGLNCEVMPCTKTGRQSEEPVQMETFKLRRNGRRVLG